MRTIIMLLMGLMFVNASAQTKLDVLYVTGHTDKYHSWTVLSEFQHALLEETGRFRVNTVKLPSSVNDEQLDFSGYDVVVLNVNEVSWPVSLKEKFEKYIHQGGGLVIVHEADNAFPEWKAFNQMIGLGGWGNRDEQAGPFVYWKDGAIVTDVETAGSAGKHGKRVPFVIHLRQPEHPIVKGLPEQWLHVNDELYGNLRGPAQNMEVIATAYSDEQSGGTGKEEPVLFTIHYGKGRIFHCVLGHTKKDFDDALKNMGYQIVFQRGTEWAATGRVTMELPDVIFSVDSPTLRSLEDIEF